MKKERADKMKKDLAQKRAALVTLRQFNGVDPESLNAKELAKLVKALLQVMGYISGGRIEV